MGRHRGLPLHLEKLQEIVDVPIRVLMSLAGGGELCADEDVGAPRGPVPHGGLSKNCLDIYVHFCYNDHLGH